MEIVDAGVGGEYMSVTGMGSTRENALAHADRMAQQYFGPEVDLTRSIGRVGAVGNHGGSVNYFTVDVEYTQTGATR